MEHSKDQSAHAEPALVETTREANAAQMTEAVPAEEEHAAAEPVPVDAEVVLESSPDEAAEEVAAFEISDEETVPVQTVLLVEQPSSDDNDVLKAIIEAAIYIADEPLTPEQIAGAVGGDIETVRTILAELVADYAKQHHGIMIRELAGGYKMGTKPEHHESIRAFVKKLQAPLKLSLPALETLAVIAYKQPITAPEIMEIRGVQGAGVLKTLLDRKLITTGGRKDVIGKPIMYKTTKEFLVQFGLSSLKELPTLKEFEELGRIALADETSAEDNTPFERPSLPAADSSDLPSEQPPGEVNPLPEDEESKVIDITPEPVPEEETTPEEGQKSDG